MIYLRQLHKQKPGIYGPPSQVQSSIFKNADREGYDPGSIALAMPMWEPGDQLDYANLKSAVNDGAQFETNRLLFSDATQDYLTVPPENIDFGTGITIFSKQEITAQEPYDWWQLAQTRDTLATSNIHFEYRLGSEYDNKASDALHYAFRASSAWHIWDARGLGYSGDFSSAIAYKYGVGSSIKGFIDGKAVSGSWKIGNGNATPPANTQNITIGNVPWPHDKDAVSGYVSILLIFNTALTPSQIAHLSDNPYFLLHRQPSVFYSVPSGAITLRQFGFRFRNDDGNESAATWNAAENTNVSLAPGSKIRVRVGIDADGDPASKDFQLEYRRKPSGGTFGDWGKVT